MTNNLETHSTNKTDSIDNKSLEGAVTSVPLPDMDIPLEFVFRNLFNQQKSKLLLTKNRQQKGTPKIAQSTNTLKNSSATGGFQPLSPTQSRRRYKASIINTEKAANTRARLLFHEQIQSSNKCNGSESENRRSPLLGASIQAEPTDDFAIAVRNHKERPQIIKLIMAMGKHFSQSRKSIHLAIVYADYLLTFGDLFDKNYEDNTYFQKRYSIFDSSSKGQSLKKMRMEPHLLAVVCILMSSKFFEIDDNLVAIQELQHFMEESKEIDRHYRISYEEVTRSEVHALERLQWDLFRILPVDFAELYLEFLKKLVQESQAADAEDVLDRVRPEVEEAFDKLMENHDEFINYRQSDVALALVRMCLDDVIEDHDNLLDQVVIDQLYEKIFSLFRKGQDPKASQGDPLQQDEQLKEVLDEISAKLRALHKPQCDPESKKQQNLKNRQSPNLFHIHQRHLASPSIGSMSGLYGKDVSEDHERAFDDNRRPSTEDKHERYDSPIQQEYASRDTAANEPKFKTAQSDEQNALVTLTSAVKHYKKAVMVTATGQKEHYIRRVPATSSAKPQSSNNAGNQSGPVAGGALLQPAKQANGHNRASSNLTNALHLSQQNKSMTSASKKQNVQKCPQRLRPSTVMESNTEGTKQTQEDADGQKSSNSEQLSKNQKNNSDVEDLSPLLASAEVEKQAAAQNAAEDNKKAVTKYVELDENFQQVSAREEYNDQETRQDVEEEEDLLQLRAQAQIEQVQIDFVLNDKERQQTAAQGQLSTRMQSRLGSKQLYQQSNPNSKPIRGDSCSSGQILTKPTNHHLTRRLQTKVNEISSQRRRSDESPNKSNQDEFKDKNFKMAMPSLKSAELSIKQLQEIKQDNQMDELVMRADPSLEPDGNLLHYKYENSCANVTKASPNNNLSQSLDVPHLRKYGLDSKQEQQKFYSFSKDFAVDKRSNQVVKNNGYQNNADQQPRGRVRSGKKTSEELGLSCQNNVFAGHAKDKEEKHPVYFAKTNSNDSGHVDAIKKKNKILMEQLNAYGPQHESSFGDVHSIQDGAHNISDRVNSLLETSKLDISTIQDKQKPLQDAQAKYGGFANADPSTGNFKARCQSTRQSKVLNQHSKSQLIKITNATPGSAAQENARGQTSRQISRQKSVNKVELNKILATKYSREEKPSTQTPSAALLLRSKQQSVRNLDQCRPTLINYSFAVSQIQKEKQSSECGDKPEENSNNKNQNGMQSQKKGSNQHNPALLKQAQQILMQPGGGTTSRNNSEYSRTILRSNQSCNDAGIRKVRKMDSADVMKTGQSHGGTCQQLAAHEDSRKQNGFANDVTMRSSKKLIDEEERSQSRAQASKSKPRQLVQKASVQFQQKALISNRSNKKMHPVRSTKHLNKCKSNNLERNPKAQTITFMDGRQNVSPQLLQSISHAINHEKSSIPDNQTQKSSERKKAQKKLKSGDNSDKMDGCHNDAFSDNLNEEEKNASPRQGQATDGLVLSRAKAKGSFSLCMSNINQRLNFKNQETHSHHRQRIAQNRTMTQDTKKSQCDANKIIRDGVQHIKLNHEEIGEDGENLQGSAATGTHQSGRALQGFSDLHSNARKNNNKKAHYLNILRAHNKQQKSNQPQIGGGTKSPQTATLISTQSTTPANGASKMAANAENVRNFHPSTKILKHVDFSLSNPNEQAKKILATNPSGERSKIKSPHTAPPREKANSTMKINAARSTGRADQDDATGHEDPYNAFELEYLNYKTQQQSKQSVNPIQRHCNKLEVNTAESDSNQRGCDKLYSMSQGATESHGNRSRMKNLSNRYQTKTLGSIAKVEEAQNEENSGSKNRNGPQPQLTSSKYVQSKAKAANLGKCNKPLDPVLARQSVITPKQGALLNGRRFESSESNQLSGIKSSKNLNPRHLKNKYQMSSSRGKHEYTLHRSIISANAQKDTSQDKLNVQKQASQQKDGEMMRTSPTPSLKKGMATNKHNNPFKLVNGQKQQHTSLQRSGGSTSKINGSSGSRGGGASIIGKKMMSFIERRQIYLNSNIALNSTEKSDAAKDAESAQLVQVKKFNLDSAEQAAQAHAETVTNSPLKLELLKHASPLQLAQATIKKPTTAAEAFKTHKSHQQKNGTSASALSLRIVANKDTQESDHLNEEEAAPSYGNFEKGRRSSRLNRQSRGKNAVNPAHNGRSTTNLIHGFSQTNVAFSGSSNVHVAKATHSVLGQSILELNRQKNNYSEVKMNRQVFEIDLDKEGSRGQCPEVKQEDGNPLKRRTSQERRRQKSSQHSRSPLQSRQAQARLASNASPLDSKITKPVKKIKPSVASQPSVILEAADQFENDGGNVAVAEDQHASKHLHKNTVVLPSQSTSYPLEPEERRPSQACFIPELGDGSKDDLSGKKLHPHSSFSNKVSSNKKRRTAQERKTSKRITQAE